MNVEGDSFDFLDNFITGTLDVANLRLGTNMYKDDRFDAGFDFDSLVPIAGFNGSIYAVTTGRQTVLPGHAHPVMNIFEGFYPQYHSIPSMVETAIAWVSEPGYVYCSEAPREGEIWRALNPDVFLK